MLKAGDVVRARKTNHIIGTIKRYDKDGRFWVLVDPATGNEIHKTGEDLAGQGAMVRTDMGPIFFDIYRGLPSYQLWIDQPTIDAIGKSKGKN